MRAIAVLARRSVALLPRVRPSRIVSHRPPMLRSVCVGFRSLSTAAASADDDGDAPTADQIFAAGAGCFQKGDTTAAENMFKEALRVDPQHERSLLQLGVIEFSRRNLHEAKAFMTDALEAPFTTSELRANTLYNLAVFTQEVDRDSSLAIQYFEQCLEQDPNHLPALMDFGKYLALNNQASRAEPLLERAWSLDHSNGLAATVYASFTMRMQRNPRKAQQILEKAVELGGDADSLSALGSLLSGLPGQARRGKGLLLQAISKNPHHATAYANLGSVCWLVENNFDDAEHYLRKAIEVDPRNVEVFCVLSSFMWDVRRDQNCLVDYLRVLDFFQRGAKSQLGCLRVWMFAKNQESARKLILHAKSISPDHEFVQENLKRFGV